MGFVRVLGALCAVLYASSYSVLGKHIQRKADHLQVVPDQAVLDDLLASARHLSPRSIDYATDLPEYDEKLVPLIALASPVEPGEIDLELVVRREKYEVAGVASEILTVNHQFPGPTIRMKKGQKFVVNLVNETDEPTTLHSHGIHFKENHMWYDGAHMITECGVPPKGSQKYVIYGGKEQTGTYWYHSHIRGQYMDGFKGLIIIEDDIQADEECHINVFDWYRSSYDTLLEDFLDYRNPDGIEPIPDLPLINGKIRDDAACTCAPGKKIRMRVLNSSGLAEFIVKVDHHLMNIVELDGVRLDGTEVEYHRISAAQRFSAIINCNQSEDLDYNIRFWYVLSLFDYEPESEHLVYGKLVYDKSSGKIADSKDISPEEALKEVEKIEEALEFVPYDKLPAYENPTKNLYLEADFTVMSDGINRGAFNEIAFVHPKVPSIYTMLTLSDGYYSAAKAYGSSTNTHVVEYGDVVQVVLVNKDSGLHPFHLHGFQFQVLKESSDPYKKGDENKDLAEIPYRRDTITVNPDGGYAVIRFKADNPGAWMFHCHIQWHFDSGLGMLFVVLPEKKGNSPVNRYISPPPKQHYENCKKLGVRTHGNAAGRDGLDLRGENDYPRPLPALYKTPAGVFGIVVDVLAFFGGLGIFVYQGLRSNVKG